jgi:hypothetical protein
MKSVTSAVYGTVQAGWFTDVSEAYIDSIFRVWAPNSADIAYGITFGI